MKVRVVIKLSHLHHRRYGENGPSHTGIDQVVIRDQPRGSMQSMSVMKGKSSWSCGDVAPVVVTADQGNTVGGVDFVTPVGDDVQLCQTL
jgi:hypothetical protein